MDEPLEDLFVGKFLAVRRRGRWEYVERVASQGAIVIVAITTHDELLFVEQPRIPLGRSTIEFPAGLVGDDDGPETPLAAAHRELLEETGYAAASIEPLLTVPSSPGLTSEAPLFVLARGAKKVGDGGGDGGESIVVHVVPRVQVDVWLQSRIAAGEAVGMMALAGLYLLSRQVT